MALPAAAAAAAPLFRRSPVWLHLAEASAAIAKACNSMIRVGWSVSIGAPSAQPNGTYKCPTVVPGKLP